MKLSKIALATAALAAIASGSAFAGQIGSSSVTVATEVIVADTQVARAPSNTYSFAGDIDARTNTQLLQLQYSVSAGTWSNVVFPAVNTLVALPPSATSMLRVSYIDAANLPQTTFPAATTINGFVTADRKTLVFNVTIPANVAAANLMKTPAFSTNANPIGASENAGISGLFTVVGTNACTVNNKNIDISFKHATTHNGNTDLISAFTTDSEHLRTNATNSARYMNFVQNQVFEFIPAAITSRTDALFLNQRLQGTNFTVAPGSATTNAFGDTLPVITAPVTRHYFGRINLKQQANGVDLDYATSYGAANAFDLADNIGNLATGLIEAFSAGLTVTLPAALPTGTVVTLRNGNGGALAGWSVVTTTAGQTSLVFTATQASLAPAFQQFALANAAFAVGAPVGGVHVWADLPGTSLINQVTGITGVALLSKQTTAGSPDQREQNLSCTGALAGIGGGIRIDIRNYASRAKYPTGNYTSIVRLINNSESQSADITAQMIYADGTYGPYGVLPTLAPRAVANYTNAQLEALLTTTPAVANPFGAGTVYTQTAGAAVVGTGSPTAPGIGDRVRFVSNQGTTLRVQSYLALPNGSVLDTTNAQGVDFENSGTRVPANALDAQPVSQDAINGLAR